VSHPSCEYRRVGAQKKNRIRKTDSAFTPVLEVSLSRRCRFSSVRQGSEAVDGRSIRSGPHRGTRFVSMPPPSADPPEEPTRPLPPTTTAPAGPLYERGVAAPVEDPYRTEILLDQLRSLRTALAIVGVIAIAALAVAVYTVLTMEEESDASHAGRAAHAGVRSGAPGTRPATKEEHGSSSRPLPGGGWPAGRGVRTATGAHAGHREPAPAALLVADAGRDAPR
jgi:hypothetical protein